MKKQKMNGRIFVILATIYIFMTGGLSCGMYVLTNYALYFYLCITCLFLGGTNLLFVLQKRSFRQPSECKSKILQKQGFQKMYEKLPVIFKTLCFVAYGIILLFGSQAVVTFLKEKREPIYPAVFNIVVFILLFVISIVLDKFCKYSEGDTEFVETMLANSRVFLKLLSFEALLAAACSVVESLEILTVQVYVGYIFTVALFYYVACILLSIIVIAIRKDFKTNPYLNIPLPFAKRFGKEQQGFVEYLETSTGISMRGLWSAKFVREIAPYVVVLTGFFLWLSTSIVQVGSEEQAVIYRLGVLKKELLQPGIHMVLPYPFDKVEIYNTEALKKTTIGFRSEENADNLWSLGHQGEEYKLLLGSGDEVVSINLRLEYKISNLKQYLKNSTSPEAILEALSYELVTDHTIHTDLATLLSTDREAFSEMFMKEITEMLEEKKVGLKVVSVVLESIHPPKEIAAVFQAAVSAEIEAGATILSAQGDAQVKLAEAEDSYNKSISLAKSEQAKSLAEAKANVTEFMASLESYQANKDSYVFYKYLNAVREAYGNANLVIISKDIDESALFFGNFSGGNNSSENSGNQEENSSAEE